jgi:hypothetical protein
MRFIHFDVLSNGPSDSLGDAVGMHFVWRWIPDVVLLEALVVFKDMPAA